MVFSTPHDIGSVFFGRGAYSAKYAKSGEQRWGHRGVRAGKNAQENGKEKTKKTEKKEGV